MAGQKSTADPGFTQHAKSCHVCCQLGGHGVAPGTGCLTQHRGSRHFFSTAKGEPVLLPISSGWLKALDPHCFPRSCELACSLVRLAFQPPTAVQRFLSSPRPSPFILSEAQAGFGAALRFASMARRTAGRARLAPLPPARTLSAGLSQNQEGNRNVSASSIPTVSLQPNCKAFKLQCWEVVFCRCSMLAQSFWSDGASFECRVGL